MEMKNRDDIIRTMSEAAESTQAVLSLWEEGSAAFGRSDEYSDVDLAAIVARGEVSTVADLLRHAAVRTAGQITESRLDHEDGSVQFYWSLEDTSQYHFVDLTLYEHTGEPRELCRDVHGDPVVHFNREKALQVVTDSLDDRAARIRASLTEHRAMSRVAPVLVERHIRRGHALHALGEYHRSILRPLVELLRIRHCPQRNSFYFTYAHWDLPRVSRFGMVLTLQSPCFGMPSARPQKMSDGIRPRVRYP